MKDMAEKEQASCVRCGFQTDKNNRYCTRCGAPLKNNCTNDGGMLGDPCHKVNPQDAAYCFACGSPTIFFKKNLIHSPYKEQEVDIEDLDELQYFQHKFFRGEE